MAQHDIEKEEIIRQLLEQMNADSVRLNELTNRRFTMRNEFIDQLLLLRMKKCLQMKLHGKPYLISPN